MTARRGIAASLMVAAFAISGCGDSSGGESVSANLGNLPASVELSSLSSKEIGNTGCAFEESVQTETGQVGVGANIRFFCDDGDASQGAVFVPEGPEFHGEDFKAGTTCEAGDSPGNARCVHVLAKYGIEASGYDENQALSRLEATAAVLSAN